LSTDKLRDERIKTVTGFTSRFARNQITEAEKAFARIAPDDDELRGILWGAYVGHIAGRLRGLIGRTRTIALLEELLLCAGENQHDH
jgi:hypothetical protein